jgi:hypothetical protein
VGFIGVLDVSIGPSTYFLQMAYGTGPGVPSAVYRIAYDAWTCAGGVFELVSEQNSTGWPETLEVKLQGECNTGTGSGSPMMTPFHAGSRRFLTSPYCGQVSSTPEGGEAQWTFYSGGDGVWSSYTGTSPYTAVLDLSALPEATWVISDGVGNSAVYSAVDFNDMTPTEFMLSSYAGKAGWPATATVVPGACP